MKNLLSALASCMLFLASQAQSPISITSSNMPVSGDTARYSNTSLLSLGNYTATGANYNWDFTYLDSTGQGMRKFDPSSATPYFFYFFPPKYGEKILDSVPIPAIPLGGFSLSIKNIYTFYKKNGTTSFNAEGLGVTLSGIPVGATPQNSNEDELYLFPLNYQDRDSTTFKFSTPTSTAIPFAYKKEGYRITEVDGWGTITTHYGSAPCLRVVTTQYSKDTIAVTGLPKLGFPNYTRSYQWLTLTEKIPFLEISGVLTGTNFTPNQARYRDNIRYFVGVKEEAVNHAVAVFPNPASNELIVITNEHKGTLNLELTDLQGKLIRSQVLEESNTAFGQHKMDVSGLAKGLYILNLYDSKGKQSLKISIQ